MAREFDRQIVFSLRRLTHDRIKALAVRHGISEAAVARLMLDKGADAAQAELERRALDEDHERQEVRALAAS